MPLPEGYLPREGDVLSVDVRVKHDVNLGEDRYIFTRVIGGVSDVALRVKDPEMSFRLKRRSWREDEYVIHNAIDRWWGKVVALHGDHVLVALDEKADRRHCPGGLRIFHCNELLPWPGDKPAAEEPPEIPVVIHEPIDSAPILEKTDGIDF